MISDSLTAWKRRCSGINKKDLTFAKKLEQVMRERNLYPVQVEKLTGVKRQRIHDYICGTHQPTAHIIRKIAIGLNVSADYLLDIKIVTNLGRKSN